MPTPAQGVAWLSAHPTRAYVPGAVQRAGFGWSWSQLCVAAMYWAVGASHTYDTADLARAASRLVAGSKTVRTGLPDGVFVWFSLGTDGHVAFVYQGRLYMASKFVTALFPGAMALGSCSSVADYEQRSGGKYLGYSWDFGGQTFTGTTSAAGTGTVTPVTPPTALIGARMPIVLEVTDAPYGTPLAGFTCLIDSDHVYHIATPGAAATLAIQYNWDHSPAKVGVADFNMFVLALQIPSTVVMKPGVQWVRPSVAAAPTADQIAAIAAGVAQALPASSGVTAAQMQSLLATLLADVKAVIPAPVKSGTITFQ